MTPRLAWFLVGACAPFVLSAQRPLRGPAPAEAPVLRPAVSVDLAAAMDDRWRVYAEPITIGRVSLGVSATWTTRADHDANIAYPAFAEPARGDACVPEFCGTSLPYYPYHEASEYRASSLNVHVRWYPQLLSRRTPTGTVSFYVGEFLGYHQRRLTTSSYYGGPVPLASDTVRFLPPHGGGAPYPMPTRSSWTTRLRGWEPGLELGVRGALSRHLVLDLGASTRVVTLDDPRSARRPGQMDPRLVVGVGVQW